MKYYIIILAMWFISCKNNNAENNHTQTSSYHQGVDDAEETGYKNGTYCAEVEYYNPNTGTRRTYDLNVEVENEQLTQIDWPNGGWLDGTHFSYENISSGECEIRSDRGYRYTITLGSFGGCGGTDGYRLKRQVEDDVASVTCPKCSGEKYSTDEYCSSCKRKIQDETCPKCGGYKFSSFDKMCSSCKVKWKKKLALNAEVKKVGAIKYVMIAKGKFVRNVAMIRISMTTYVMIANEKRRKKRNK
jgi:hypothetical protein